MNILQNNLSQPKFKGLTNSKTPCMFVFDLDGTLAEGSGSEIKRIIKAAKSRNAQVIYATGRDKNRVEELQNDLLYQNIYLPTPDYLVARNGEHVYKNIDGELYKDVNYNDMVKKDNNFDKEKITKILSQYEELEPIQNDKTIMIGYSVDSKNNIEETRNNVIKTLAENKINVFCGYTKDYDKNIIFLAPFNKASGVNYIKKNLDIPNDEILLTGNDNNDISMAKMAASGSKFICLNNASENLKKVCKNIKKRCDNIYMSINDGTQGILEGFIYFVK